MIDKYKAFLSEFKNTISLTEFTIWFADLVFHKFEDGVLYLSTSDFFKQKTITEKYLISLRSIAPLYFRDVKDVSVFCEKNIDKKDIEKTGIVSENIPKDTPNEPSNPSVTKLPTDVKSDINNHSIAVDKGQSKTSNANLIHFGNDLDNFVITVENEYAHRVAKRIIDNPGVYTPLYFYGQVGVGKTHLLQGIGSALQKNYPFFNIQYITNPREFSAEFSCIAHNQEAVTYFRNKYATVDLLLIDDVQFFADKTKTCIELFSIFNHIKSLKKQMVFCSDRTPSELQGIDVRLKSRFSQSVIIEMEPPQFEGRKKIISYYATQFSLLLTEEVIDFVAENTDGDIRKIIGALQTMSVAEEQEINLEFCQKYIKQALFFKNENDSPQNLIRSIANHFNLSMQDIYSNKRTTAVSEGRAIVIYFLRKYTNLSNSEIGRLLGGKTPSTISQAYKKTQEKLATNFMYKKTINSIVHQLRL